jgi:predicted nucleic acid-binding protein
MGWYFADEDTPYAQSVRELVLNDGGVVTAFWPFEVENAVLNGEKRQRSTLVDSSAFFRFLLALNVDRESASPQLGLLLSLARDQRLSVYEAAFVELAARRRLPLATTDNNMKLAARRLGVDIFDPD